jgi:hypothetical protein
MSEVRKSENIYWSTLVGMVRLWERWGAPEACLESEESALEEPLPRSEQSCCNL